jgi:hypothetical protein
MHLVFEIAHEMQQLLPLLLGMEYFAQQPMSGRL